MSNPSLAQAGFTQLPASLAPPLGVEDPAAAPPPDPRTIAQLMSRLFEIREERKQLALRDKELVEEWEGIEGVLLAKLDEQGSVRISSKDGTASIGKQVLPLVEDWDAFYGYIKENDAFHLLQRRPATNAYRELLEADSAAHQGEEDSDRPPVVPGVRPIEKRSINLRAGT